jgi:hypothetical protein
MFVQNFGRYPRRGNVEVCLNVIASAAKQSILSLRHAMDCFALLAMTTVERVMPGLVPGLSGSI